MAGATAAQPAGGLERTDLESAPKFRTTPGTKPLPTPDCDLSQPGGTTQLCIDNRPEQPDDSHGATPPAPCAAELRPNDPIQHQKPGTPHLHCDERREPDTSTKAASTVVLRQLLKQMDTGRESMLRWRKEPPQLAWHSMIKCANDAMIRSSLPLPAACPTAPSRTAQQHPDSTKH